MKHKKLEWKIIHANSLEKKRVKMILIVSADLDISFYGLYLNNHKTQWNKKSVKCARIKGSDLKHQAIQIESVRKNFTIVIIYQRFNFQWKIFFNLLKRVKVENWSNKCICTKKSFLSQLGMIYSLARNYAASRRSQPHIRKKVNVKKPFLCFFEVRKADGNWALINGK